MPLMSAPPSFETLAMLKALQGAVVKCLDKKQKLGQYAVFWRNGQVVMVGPDAPTIIQQAVGQPSGGQYR